MRINVYVCVCNLTIPDMSEIYQFFTKKNLFFIYKKVLHYNVIGNIFRRVKRCKKILCNYGKKEHIILIYQF